MPHGLDPRRGETKQRHGLLRRRRLGIAVQVDVKAVVPGLRTAGARLDLGQVDTGGGEGLQRTDERTRRQEISMVIPQKKYTQKKLLQAGMPLKPRAPPILSIFRISTRMISPNPRVTMAR